MFWTLHLFCYLGHIFLSWCTCYVLRGRALGICQGGTIHITVLWCCMWGRSHRGKQCCLFSSWLAFSHFLQYLQANLALLVLIPGWMVCLCSRTLWNSPVNSPVSLGVSPAASTPIDFFSQRFGGRISPYWNPGVQVYLASQLYLPVYLHTSVELPTLPAAAWPILVLQPPHAPCPLYPSSPSPSLLPV